jgi:hypothetical protein
MSTTTEYPMHIYEYDEKNILTDDEELSLMYSLLLNCSEKQYDGLIEKIHQYSLFEVIMLYDKICSMPNCTCNNNYSDQNITTINTNTDFSSEEKEKENEKEKEIKTNIKCETCLNKKTKIRKLVVKELTKRWQDFDNGDSKYLSYSLVKDFLETDDYSHAPKDKMNDLETFLVRLIIVLCREKNISDEQFNELFDLIKWDCVDHNTIYILYKLKQCRNLIDKSNKFATKFADVITTPSKRSKSRVKDVETSEKKIIELTFDDIQIGEEYEVKDRLNHWYIAKVHTKVGNIGVKVSFFGFDSNEDRTFIGDEIDGNFAKVGTYTNGLKHNAGDCNCTGCEMMDNEC